MNNRQEIGHCEIIGQRSGGGEVLLTLTERVRRYEMIIKIPSKTSPHVMAALDQLKNEYEDHFHQVFNSMTSDNGTEFSELSMLESTGCKGYFTHPYSLGERGTNQNHNGMIRRFIPKGKLMEDVSIALLEHVQEWMNKLPRKILNDLTPEEIFEDFLDQVYQIST